jgi:hypothetical protein
MALPLPVPVAELQTAADSMRVPALLLLLLPWTW